MDTKSHVANVTKTENGFTASIEKLNHVTAVGTTEQQLKNNMIDALDKHYNPYIYQLKIVYKGLQ